MATLPGATYWLHFTNSVCSLDVSVSCFGNSGDISKFSIILVICDQLLLDVTANIVLGHHSVCPCQVMNLIPKWWQKPDCSPSLLSGLFGSQTQNKIEMRPLILLQWLYVEVKGRVTQLPLWIKSWKWLSFSEEGMSTAQVGHQLGLLCQTVSQDANECEGNSEGMWVLFQWTSDKKANSLITDMEKVWVVHISHQFP